MDQSGIGRALIWAEEMLDKALYYASSILLIVTATSVFYTVVMRYVFNSAPLWAKEAPRIFFIWMTYLAIAVAANKRNARDAVLRTECIMDKRGNKLANDDLADIRPHLERALDLHPEDVARISPEAKKLLTIRRRLGHTWLDDYEVVVEVLSSETCPCGVAPGQVVVFDMRHSIQYDKSTAPLCMHMLSPILAVFYMTFDRAAEGLNPISGIWQFYDCLDTGDDDGKGKTRTRVYLRSTRTGKVIDSETIGEEGPGT